MEDEKECMSVLIPLPCLGDMSVLVLMVTCTPSAVLWAPPEQSSLCMCVRMYVAPCGQRTLMVSRFT